MGNRSWERLLEAEHEHGVAVVYRDRRDGSYWLSGSAEDGGSGMTEQRFTVEGLHDGWVQGGFLPQGATRALARDAQGAWFEATVGNGVWLALTRASPLAVRFEDAGGRVVRCPLDARQRERASDATAPCVACGAAEWDVASRAPAHLGESEDRAVVCRRCGHQVAMGVWYGDAAEATDAQPPGAWWRDEDAMRQIFAAARFPVYGLVAWEGERRWAGHGQGARGVDHIRLAHTGRGRVVVDTSLDANAGNHARQLERTLQQLVTPPPSEEAWQRLSPAALAALMEQEELRAGERVAAVVMHDLTIAVDGRERGFLAGRCGDHWAAVATLGDGMVTIGAERTPLEEVALERVRDIEPYLNAGPG